MEADHAEIIESLFELALATEEVAVCAVLVRKQRQLLVRAPHGVGPAMLHGLRDALVAALHPAAPTKPLRLDTLVLPSRHPRRRQQPRHVHVCPCEPQPHAEIAIAFADQKPLDDDRRARLDAIAARLGRICLLLFGEYARHERDLKHVHDMEQLKDRFLSAMSHELRSPLTVLSGLLELLRESTLSDRQDEFVGHALDQVGRLRWLMENLLDLSKIESGTVDLSREPLPVDVLVDKAVASLRYEIERRGLALEASVEPALPAVCVDANRVTQVLVNLVDNAAKYTPSGGTVRVSARRSGDEIELSVSDTGRGIPRHEQDAVFDRYYRLGRRGAAGTGLGLSIAKEIVDSHHGRIWLQSAEGRGSTFFFTLPMYRAEASLRRFIADLRNHAQQLSAPLTFTLLAVEMHQQEHVVNAFVHGSEAVFEYRDGGRTVLILASFRHPRDARVNAERVGQRMAAEDRRLSWAFVHLAGDDDVERVLTEVAALSRSAVWNAARTQDVAAS